MMMKKMKMRATCSSVILGHFFWTKLFLGMPWLKQLVTGLSLRKPVFNHGPVRVGFVWTNWHWDRAFSSSALVFPYLCLSVCASQSYFVHLPLVLYNLSNWPHSTKSPPFQCTWCRIPEDNNCSHYYENVKCELSSFVFCTRKELFDHLVLWSAECCPMLWTWLTLHWCWGLISNYCWGWRIFKVIIHGAPRSVACEELKVCIVYCGWHWGVN